MLYYNLSATEQTTDQTTNEAQEERNAAAKRRRRRKIRKLLEYAEEKYSCRFQENFKNKLLRIAPEKNIFLPESVIDALVKEWKIWEPYVTPESFIRFIEDGITSMIKINATATFHSPDFNGFIGEKATVIKPLPDILATCVSKEGILFVNGEPTERE